MYFRPTVNPLISPDALGSLRTICDYTGFRLSVKPLVETFFAVILSPVEGRSRPPANILQATLQYNPPPIQANTSAIAADQLAANSFGCCNCHSVASW